MNKLLTLSALTACLTLTMPVATWANNIEETVTTAQENVVKFCNANNVNIRKEPSTQSEIIDRAMLNARFEIIEEKDGWSKFFGEDDNGSGYGYIKSEYLSDKEIAYSKEDLLVFAKIACGEAQYCDDQEQRLVLSVLLNRMKHSEFPDTALGVASDRRWGIQYASWYDGNADRTPTESNWANAKWVLENGSILPDYVIWQSKDKQGKGVFLKTKWHTYCY